MLRCVFLISVLAVFESFSINSVDPRSVLIQNFLESNKETIKSTKNDQVLSNAIVQSMSINSSSSTLQDDFSNSLVLMDSTTACDSGWTKSSVNGMCYKIATSDTTWYAAEDWCFNQRYGSHLTSVHSQAEAQWIAATYITGGSWFPYMDNWVGLRRSCDNTSYIWTDGTPVDYLWWQPGYPGSKDPEQSCVTIWVTTLLKLNPLYVMGQFDDIWDCGTNLATPTCRYDPTSTAPHIKYDTSYTCRDSTTAATTTTVTTTTSVTTTTPPTTTTSTTTTTAAVTTPTTTTPTSTTTTETTTTTTPTTTTTTPTTTTNTPTTTTTTTPTTTTNTAPGNCSTTCDKYWVSYRGACYGVVRGTSNFYTAKLACHAFGGEMAEITDLNMNEAIRCLCFVNNPNELFLPVAFSSNNDSSIINQAWVGPSSYANWAPGKPNQAQGAQYTEYCNVVTLSVVNSGLDFGFSRGVWTDYPCELTQQFAICKQN